MGKAYDGAMALYGLGKKLSAPAVGAGLATQSEDADAGIVNVIDEATGAAKRVIEAWHGSPHKFDKFSMDGIGTGEGAQAYGHGLYFADSEDVARGYRGELTGRDAQASFQSVLPDDADFDDFYDALEDGAFTESQERVIRALADNDWLGFDYPSQAINAAYRDIDRYDPSPELRDALGGEGALYRVHLDVDPDTLLDWDKPLSEQSEAVRERLSKHMGELDSAIESNKKMRQGVVDRVKSEGRKPTEAEKQAVNDASKRITAYNSEKLGIGRDFVEGLNRGFGPDGASKYLHDMGIPGIRYLDGMSRDGGSGTYNYVMFDDAPISIMERGNAAPELLGYMGAVGGSLAAYGKLREEKEGRWAQLKQEAISMASGVGNGINFALESLEIPTRGLHGLASAAGVLAFGGSVEDAVRRGATVAQQPLDTTAQQVGQYVADETGNPYLAAGADAITRVMALEP